MAPVPNDERASLMTHITSRLTLGGHRRAATRAVAAAALAAATTGCSLDDILDVDDVDVATPESLTGAAALPIVLGGAVANFQVGYFGSGNVNESSGQIGYSGLLADEIRSSDTFPTRNDIDQRRIQLDNSSNEAQFIALSRARSAADLAIRRYQEFGPDEPGLALAYALDGFSTIMFGENYCSGVPFSTLTDAGGTVYGMPLTTVEMFERAVAKFDSALALEQITGEYENLALVGKARAHLNLGEYAEAAAAAAQVDDGFDFLIAASATTNRQNNGVWTFFQNTERLTLVNDEGGNGLDFLAANDPRVPYLDEESAGFDDVTNYVEQLLYPARDSDVPLATDIEARLIVAEAQLNGAVAGSYLTTLNEIRADNGLAADLTDPGTEAGRVDQLFRERAFWLFLTSHRLGDLRRLIRQYDRTEDQVFPVGNWHKGGTYGDDVNLPVPAVEENNPNFTGCLDRDA